jgi:hypothetical protein
LVFLAWVWKGVGWGNWWRLDDISKTCPTLVSMSVGQFFSHERKWELEGPLLYEMKTKKNNTS